jgi:hypothetical protein
VSLNRTICLDFDGVLNDYKQWDGEDKLFKPREGVANFLLRLRQLGYDIIICSCREPAKIRPWLIEHGLSVYIKDVVTKKPPALVYLDDRGLKFEGNYDMALVQITSFETYWE